MTAEEYIEQVTVGGFDQAEYVAKEDALTAVQMARQEALTKQKTCRTCENRQRWECGGRVIQYCGVRASKRTFNRLMKIKVTAPACGMYKEAAQ